MTEMIQPQPITITAADGQRLSAYLFEPRQPNGMSVQINGATGVPARYYAPFSQHLAQRGFTVLTYDFRGIASSPRSEGAPPPRMLDWGVKDVPAASAWLRRNRPGLQRCIVAHSFGGQVLGLIPEADEIAAAVTIGSQHGYWRNWSMPHRLYLPFWWYVMVPGLAAATGRLPGLFVGGNPLPEGVARDWARFCRSRHYLIDDNGRPLRPYNDRVRARMRLISFSDDPVYGPARGVDALAGFYPNAKIERLHVAPSDWGLQRIGHFGFFKRGMPVERWDEVANWLQQAAANRNEKAA
jgi:predicted alpha/beta hydrolase